jgi:ubiquinone/menaquinone biosynthesis C-methylase UbiE
MGRAWHRACGPGHGAQSIGLPTGVAEAGRVSKMSTYVLMRILESFPRRYELGIRVITLGQLGRVYDRLASHIVQGQQVLDLGCGTGTLTLRAARRGAKVKGIDVNAQMLEIARRRVHEAGLSKNVDLFEMGVSELDREKADSYDAVMSGLCFSELSEDELRYTLKHVRRILRPGGLLLVTDEVRPRTLAGRLVHSLARAPLVAVTYLVTQKTTHPIDRLPEKVAGSGFSILSVEGNVLGTLLNLVARKPIGERCRD